MAEDLTNMTDQPEVNEYCEENQIAYTIQRWFPDLMTEFELRVRFVSVSRAKSAASGKVPTSPYWFRRLQEIDLERVDAELAEGYMPFLRRVARRVMNESPNDVVLNRCARCKRVVGTPMAKWCKWCKYDWH